MKRLLIFTLILSLLFGIGASLEWPNINADQDDAFSSVKQEQLINESITYVEAYDESSSYYGVYQNWMLVEGDLPTAVYTITPDEYIGGNHGH